MVFHHELPLTTADGDRTRPLPSFPDMHSLNIFLTTTSRGGAVLVIDGELGQETTDGVDGMAELIAAACFARHEIMVEELPIIEWAKARLKETGVSVEELYFGSDVHQCVFLGGSLQEAFLQNQDAASVNQMAARILYRGTVSADSGARLGINIPDRLNNPGSTFVAHGRGVSLFSGWSPHLENAFALTTISMVSALEALRLSRHEAFSAMALSQDSAGASPKDARELVSRLSDRLNEMQLDLSFGVEAHTDSILIPEMIVEAFQSSLNNVVRIHESLDNTSRMLQRVDTVISARMAKLQAGDRERAERRDRLVAVLVAIASLLALPPALLLAFFGVNASNVHARESIFDLHAYWGAYIIAWLPFVLLIAVGWILHSRLRRHQV
ncbi:MAG: hypothetical protein J2P25_04440 [Nocardiopsaceae bacterium]|nr:hypothetical protein [Nocardiopsaceae bacterium]